MSIRPVKFTSGGAVEVFHDERGHGGVVQLRNVQFGRKPDQTDDFRFIELPCPVEGCGSLSVHPAGGGADPERVQELFVRALHRHPRHTSRSLEEARLAVKAMAEEMDGPGRFRLETVEEL